MSRRQRKNAISDQFVPHLLSMLESPAYRVLSRAARMVLDRVEIEHMHHGGVENGNLPVTYDQFEDHGVHRHAIAPGIREAVALGFLEITEQGRAGNTEFRRASRYRLTYRHTPHESGDGTHEWRRIETIEEGRAIAKKARSSIDLTNISVIRQTKRNLGEKQISSDGKRDVLVSKTGTKDVAALVANTATTASVRKPPLLSISRDGWPTATAAKHATASGETAGPATSDGTEAGGGPSATPHMREPVDTPNSMGGRRSDRRSTLMLLARRATGQAIGFHLKRRDEGRHTWRSDGGRKISRTTS
jgi:hypothetical protein